MSFETQSAGDIVKTTVEALSKESKKSQILGTTSAAVGTLGALGIPLFISGASEIALAGFITASIVAAISLISKLRIDRDVIHIETVMTHLDEAQKIELGQKLQEILDTGFSVSGVEHAVEQIEMKES